MKIKLIDFIARTIFFCAFFYNNSRTSGLGHKLTTIWLIVLIVPSLCHSCMLLLVIASIIFILLNAKMLFVRSFASLTNCGRVVLRRLRFSHLDSTRLDWNSS